MRTGDLDAGVSGARGPRRSDDVARTRARRARDAAVFALGASAWLGAAACVGAIDAPSDSILGDPTSPRPTTQGVPPTGGPGPSPSPSPTTNPSPSPSPSPSPTTPPDPNAFTCAPGAAPPADETRRLSRTELRNTVRDLIAPITQGDTEAVLTELDATFDRVPVDQRRPLPNEKHGGYTKLDQAVNQPHVDALFQLGDDLGRLLTANATRVERLVGRCAVDGDRTNDAACVDDFLRRFLERAHRRTPSAEDLAFYRGVYGANGIDLVGLADVVAVAINAPEFFYRFEHGASAVGSSTTTFALGAFELAARLSYHLVASAPDDPLLEAARDGSLLRDDVYAQQVERLLQSPRAREAADTFFREWLWLDELPRLDGLVGTPLMDAFAGADRPTAGLRDAVVREVLDAAAHYTFDADATLPTFFQSNAVFTDDPLLARIYGVPPWSGQGAPPETTQAGRAGLLTRAAFLMTGTPNTRPIMKGLFVRKALLCDYIPPPPDNAAAMPPQLRSDMTTREVVEEITEQAGTSCAGCHSRSINPMGFASENFDALARPRTMQQLFDAQGRATTARAVNTRTRPFISADDEREVADVAEAAGHLATSGRLEACFSRQYLRYTFGRVEDVARDGCTIEPVRQTLARGGSMLDAMKTFLSQPAFRQRRFAL
jgi:hypothetical protein